MKSVRETKNDLLQSTQMCGQHDILGRDREDQTNSSFELQHLRKAGSNGVDEILLLWKEGDI